MVLYQLLSRTLLLDWRLQPATGAPSGSGSCGPEVASQLLAYAGLVAGGHRAPLPPFWPRPVAALVAACLAGEPHERPRVAEVAEALAALAADEGVVAALNSYRHEDVEFVPAWALGASCGSRRGSLEAAAAGGGAGEGSGVDERSVTPAADAATAPLAAVEGACDVRAAAPGAAAPASAGAAAALTAAAAAGAAQQAAPPLASTDTKSPPRPDAALGVEQQCGCAIC